MADVINTTVVDDNGNVVNDGVQHGIDNNPNHDAEKGATLGGIGGVVTGALAGSLAGPVGTLTGAIIGGIAGAVASGAAVAAVDRVDNDNTISGLGSDHNTYANSADGHHYGCHRWETCFLATASR